MPRFPDTYPCDLLALGILERKGCFSRQSSNMARFDAFILFIFSSSIASPMNQRAQSPMICSSLHSYAPRHVFYCSSSPEGAIFLVQTLTSDRSLSLFTNSQIVRGNDRECARALEWWLNDSRKFQYHCELFHYAKQ